jgi:nickel transport protein
MRIRISAITAVLVLVGGFLLTSFAHAHDVWMTPDMRPDGLQMVIHHGHPGDRKRPDPDKLFDLRAFAPDRQVRSLPGSLTSATRDGNPVLLVSSLESSVDDGTWLFAAQYDNGYWVKTAQGHRNTSKRQVAQPNDSMYSMKYAKALVIKGGPTPGAHSRVVGHRLELVPIDNPFDVPVGGRLHVRVLYEGKSVEGIGVEIGDGVTARKEEEIPRYMTNGNGIARVPIEKAGLQVIVVDYSAASAHPDLADKELMAATLSFIVP